MQREKRQGNIFSEAGGSLNQKLKDDLESCYRNVLECCVEHGIRSVAFCCISTGEFHFPNDEAAKIAADTVTGFLKSMVRTLTGLFSMYSKMWTGSCMRRN